MTEKNNYTNQSRIYERFVKKLSLAPSQKSPDYVHPRNSREGVEERARILSTHITKIRENATKYALLIDKILPSIGVNYEDSGFFTNSRSPIAVWERLECLTLVLPVIAGQRKGSQSREEEYIDNIIALNSVIDSQKTEIEEMTERLQYYEQGPEIDDDDA